MFNPLQVIIVEIWQEFAENADYKVIHHYHGYRVLSIYGMKDGKSIIASDTQHRFHSSPSLAV